MILENETKKHDFQSLIGLEVEVLNIIFNEQIRLDCAFSIAVGDGEASHEVLLESPSFVNNVNRIMSNYSKELCTCGCERPLKGGRNAKSTQEKKKSKSKKKRDRKERQGRRGRQECHELHERHELIGQRLKALSRGNVRKERYKVIVDALSEGVILDDISSELGLAARTIWTWRKGDATFDGDCKDALAKWRKDQNEREVMRMKERLKKTQVLSLIRNGVDVHEVETQHPEIAKWECDDPAFTLRKEKAIAHAIRTKRASQEERQAKELIISCVRGGLTLGMAARVAGVSHYLLTRWRNEDEQFRKDGDEAKGSFAVFLSAGKR